MTERWYVFISRTLLRVLFRGNSEYMDDCKLANKLRGTGQDASDSSANSTNVTRIIDELDDYSSLDGARQCTSDEEWTGQVIQSDMMAKHNVCFLFFLVGYRLDILSRQ